MLSHLRLNFGTHDAHQLVLELCARVRVHVRWRSSELLVSTAVHVTPFYKICEVYMICQVCVHLIMASIKYAYLSIRIVLARANAYIHDMYVEHAGAGRCQPVEQGMQWI